MPITPALDTKISAYIDTLIPRILRYQNGKYKTDKRYEESLNSHDTIIKDGTDTDFDRDMGFLSPGEKVPCLIRLRSYRTKIGNRLFDGLAVLAAAQDGRKAYSKYYHIIGPLTDLETEWNEFSINEELIGSPSRDLRAIR